MKRNNRNDKCQLSHAMAYRRETTLQHSRVRRARLVALEALRGFRHSSAGCFCWLIDCCWHPPHRVSFHSERHRALEAQHSVEMENLLCCARVLYVPRRSRPAAAGTDSQNQTTLSRPLTSVTSRLKQQIEKEREHFTSRGSEWSAIKERKHMTV